ncbi:TetR/AcrR family transcriptional regulator [Streptomyces minutiscleroticus]|uniref:Transcriptional regulator n=1 Tax=Streptomyces minutiscleroticus TaxID=68238 RepID=A0A918U1B8_9ACTN|nr:TetR/AcrR family transcriptional regulator [Streptomyces minutiscleroticus]GGX79332.1 transcriptional regulator [Streptomyces minutiscleroticus]
MTQVRAGAPRPMRADARRNYERLLAEAAAAFAEHGEGASLDDIAKRAGVGSGTLYRHFPTRYALLEAVYVGSVEEIAGRADAYAARLPPGEALLEWLTELGEHLIRLRGLKALLGSAGTDGRSALFGECGQGLRDAAARLVGAARRAGAVREDVEPLDVLRLAHGIATASEVGDGRGQHVRRYMALLAEGLCGGAGTGPSAGTGSSPQAGPSAGASPSAGTGSCRG